MAYELCDFSPTKSLELFETLKSRNILPEAEAEAAAYGLQEIAESMAKVYCDLIPRILNNPNATTDVIRDLYWDIREEFRHIDYHIRDGKLVPGGTTG